MREKGEGSLKKKNSVPCVGGSRVFSKKEWNLMEERLLVTLIKAGERTEAKSTYYQC